MKNQTCSFTVSGVGRFPFDMLRYDQCAPIFPDDARNIGSTGTGPGSRRDIRLNSTKTYPTTGRWESFGWNVTEIEGHYPADEAERIREFNEKFNAKPAFK